MALVKNISVAKSKRFANYEDYEELLYCTISSTINKQITSHEKKREITKFHTGSSSYARIQKLGTAIRRRAYFYFTRKKYNSL